MNDLVKSVNLKDGNVLEIYYDSDARSPREDDEGLIGIMAAFHNKYTLTDSNVPFNAEQFEGWDEMEDYIKGTLKSVACLPLYMYSHSGITIKTSPFSCNWDSGQIGFIYTTAKHLSKIGVNMTDDEDWAGYVKRVTEYMESEVNTFDEYVKGEVFGFQVKDSEGEDVNSCWGFYGSDFKTNGILEHVESEPVNLDDL